MRKPVGHIYLLFVFLLSGIAGVSFAQQTPSYSQFIMNQYALNPAIAGTNIGMEALVGSRVQWIGMPNAPVTNFGSVTFGWRKNFSYKGHHGVGFYGEDDRQGMYSSKAAYVSYAYHIRIFTGLQVAAGKFVGVRRLGFNQLLFDFTGPARHFLKGFGIVFSAVILRTLLYTKKLYFDASIRQVYVNKIKQGKFQIGSTGSKLDPTLIVAVKRRFTLGDNSWTVVPAVMMQYAIKGTPYVQGNCMLFYHRKIGFGASVRGTSFASAIFQIRFLKNMVAGIAYDYPINKLRVAGLNTFELMIAFTPGHGDEGGNKPRMNVAQCPDFDF